MCALEIRSYFGLPRRAACPVGTMGLLPPEQLSPPRPCKALGWPGLLELQPLPCCLSESLASPSCEEDAFLCIELSEMSALTIASDCRACSSPRSAAHTPGTFWLLGFFSVLSVRRPLAEPGTNLYWL